MLRIFIILSFFVNSCKSNEVKNNLYCAKIHQLIKEKAKEYVRELHQGDENYSLFIYAEIKNNDSNKDYYEVVIYAYTVLWDEFPVLPYSFTEYKYKGNNFIYFFDESKQIKMNKSNPIYKKLKDKELIKSINNKAKIEEVKFMLDDSIESWNLFVCKNNLEEIEIVKSNYVLESNEKPSNVCK